MVATDTKEVLNNAVEVVGDAVDLVERRVSWLRTTNAKLFLVGTLGIALGATVSYVISANHLKTKYQKLADEQVEDVKNHYAALHKVGDKGDLNALAAKYDEEKTESVDDSDVKAAVVDLVERRGYVAYEKVNPSSDSDTQVQKASVTEALTRTEVVVEEPVERNVFESHERDSYFDFDTELKRREENPEKPYVMTKDEFEQNDEEFEEAVLTYFEGDNVLADIQDQGVGLDVVGEENLLRFGHGSGDKKVVYVCNPKLEVIFEVTQSDGTYAHEVLGVIEHSDKRAPRRFRQSDE